jgi:hypothetical protein
MWLIVRACVRVLGLQGNTDGGGYRDISCDLSTDASTWRPWDWRDANKHGLRS